MPVNRRRFFTQSGAIAATSLVAPQIVRSAEPAGARPGQKPNRIIHMVADGMAMATLSMADHLSRAVRGRGLTWMSLYSQPGTVPAYMDVRSLNSLVTDSSASSCAWGSGSRIVNGTVNILPDGTILTPLYTLFGQQGWKRALVTTTEITHATPAGFAASGLKREAAESIAVQYMERGMDVLLGGGQKFFDPAKRKDKRDLVADYKTAGYQVFKTAKDFAAANNDAKWLGIFANSHLPFTVDWNHDAKHRETVPHLAELTRKALAKLENESHFIMQVEGGRVDHAAHMCDAVAALYDQVAFDEAIDVCLDFQKRHPDTLIVITTDHPTGNPGLSGIGLNYGFSSALFTNVQRVKKSFSEILKQWNVPGPDTPLPAKGTIPPPVEQDPKAIADAIREATDYQVSLEKAAVLAPFLTRKGKAQFALMNAAVAQLGQLMANHIGIGWTGTAHCSDFVPLTALGPGAELFRGFILNTDVFRHYTQLADIDFKNPSLPIKEDLRVPQDLDRDLQKEKEKEAKEKTAALWTDAHWVAA
ncbi:MAG: alkaline phosphatase [Verrucomicrobia bacterium]|nr:alkaline phosphatase [Verrucomicrobiota bacterium]